MFLLKVKFLQDYCKVYSKTKIEIIFEINAIDLLVNRSVCFTEN